MRNYGIREMNGITSQMMIVSVFVACYSLLFVNQSAALYSRQDLLF